ncbi:MAG TPA: ArdC-like ssDNA-binding domain-containing protein [Pirellulaceae bacterium]|nr:ArdC-like ssDNA-binding domain-containing protein [Pirellulaceae bacterium]HMO93578.1 ArdC-like ssDNA-binding domain-containing protein [Pirellulaceae bacterium]HMP71430.1 ArdC-like ssDNA-binding domain-containing protein [Pirellulaceae bacterium]
MNRDDALKMSDQALQELANALQQGKSEELLTYLDFCSKFHRYSFGNCMLIALQFPAAKMVAGFSRWKELGRFVKKGEKGIAILAPILSRAKQKDKDGNEGEEPEDRKARYLRGFRVVHVFDVSQTEGAEIPDLNQVEGDPGDNIERLERLVESKGIVLHYEPDLDGAFGMSKGGSISVLENMPKAQTFAVLVHEFAHELLHRGDRRSETTKTMRETEAEAVAYIVCRAVGMPSNSSSADYIQLWNGDLPMLAQSLELIRDVAANIITELETSVSEEVADAA